MDEALRGGMTEGVRRGGEVHRTAGPWTDTVHDLLRHLRARGIDRVPEPRGRDAEGREVLEHLAGEVPRHPLPRPVWAPAVLEAAAVLLRRLHDAGAGFDRAGRTWQLPAHEPDEVICHNDFAPHNLVFRDGLPWGVIDWDTASPGPRAWDLAHLAYRLVPFTAPGHPEAPPSSAAVRAQRLRALCAAYTGAAAPPGCAAADVLAAAPDRVAELATLTRKRAAATGSATLAGHVALYRRDVAHLLGAGARLLDGP